ncbi:MAG: GAF domain-containing protein [Anaerolineae bacterium]|nr:GAF domain-containing protein [Anaerolineae bacterium]
MIESRILLLGDDSFRQLYWQLLPDGYVVINLPELKEEARPVLALLDLAWLQEQNVPQVLESLEGIPLLALLTDLTGFHLLNPFLSQLELRGVLVPPFVTPENCALVEQVLLRQRPDQAQLQADLARANRALNQRLQEINTIYTIGKSIVSTLDLEAVLSRVVTASVNLTQAEEGFILLYEEEILYLRAAKNMTAENVERFHKEVSDSVAWRVIRSGRPVMLHRKTKIATDYLASALLYVPLQGLDGSNVGVLAVINRTRDLAFTESQLFTLSSLADFASITLENVRLFEAMVTEQSRLRSILRHATEIVLITDEQNRLLLWSRTAADAFNIPATAQGVSLQDALNHADLIDLFANDAECVHAEIALADGQVFNAQLTTVPGVGRVAVMQDITHLKELDRLKSEFVSTVSHDLRTPLTTIQGYIELLNRVGPLTNVQEKFIDKALRSLTYITELITDLLDIGRIEAGYNLEMHNMWLDLLLEEVGEELLPQAVEADVTLSWETEPGLAVLGNRRRLRQVLENLLSNAIKYNRAGGWVRMQARSEGAHVIFSVVDNGFGIALGEQSRIFERFYRVCTPETDTIQGTGLGLAIVKSVIEKHKGRIWVDSALGKGSSFTFILPGAREAPREK